MSMLGLTAQGQLQQMAVMRQSMTYIFFTIHNHMHITFLGGVSKGKQQVKDLLFIFSSRFSFALHNIKPEFDIKTKNLI